MITEQDIIFDELYPEVSEELDAQFITMVKEIKEELDIPSNIMETIVQTWVEGISEVMPKEVE
jgi:hypothetical protein